MLTARERRNMRMYDKSLAKKKGGGDIRINFMAVTELITIKLECWSLFFSFFYVSTDWD